MKRFFAAVLMLACVTASGQTGTEAKAYISADIPSVITSRSIRLGFSHSFCSHWSAEGDVAMPFRHMLRKSEEETEHDGMFEDERNPEQETAESKVCAEFRMGIRYWPREFLRGGYMGISCSHNMVHGADIIVGVGYAVRIWKCIGLAAGYEIKVLDSFRNGEFGTEGIMIGINYIF